MRNKRIPLNHREKTPELQFTSVLAYLQACIILKDHRASVFCTAVDVKFLRSIVCIVDTLSKLFSLSSKAQVSELLAIAKE